MKTSLVKTILMTLSLSTALTSIAAADYNTQWGRGEYDSRDYQFDRRMGPRKAEMIVEAYYRGFLLRASDVSGKANWVQMLLNRGVDSVSEVAYHFGNSVEFQSQVRARFNSRQIIRNVFREILGRDAEREAVIYYSRMIDEGRAGEAFSQITSSNEFRLRFGL